MWRPSQGPQPANSTAAPASTAKSKAANRRWGGVRKASSALNLTNAPADLASWTGSRISFASRGQDRERLAAREGEVPR